MCGGGGDARTRPIFGARLRNAEGDCGCGPALGLEKDLVSAQSSKSSVGWLKSRLHACGAQMGNPRGGQRGTTAVLQAGTVGTVVLEDQSSETVSLRRRVAGAPFFLFCFFVYSPGGWGVQ